MGRNSLQLSTKPRRGRSNIHTQAPDLTNKSIIHSTTMKFSKRTTTALVSALMLGSGAIGMAKADCGFGFDNSCADDDHVQVGVWLCEDMDSCDCQPNVGCSNGYYRDYILDPNEPNNNVACDTLGGWRPDDEGYSGAYDAWINGAHVEVHPADYGKLGDYAGNVKAKIGMGDYCTGPQYWDVGLSAWDDDNDQPGDWWFDDAIQVKSVRPYVDFEQMWGSEPAPGIGVKMNVWPDRHMSIPYDQATDVPNLPDGSIQKPEDQVWCLDGSGAGFPYGGVWWGGWGEHYPQVPAGSILFGLYDGGVAPRDGCDTSRSDYCGSVDQDNTCLGVRLYQNGDNVIPSSWDDDFVAETYIKMRDLCDDSYTACINTTDGSEDDEAGICTDNAFTKPDGTPFYNDDGSAQLWFTNYIVQVVPNCDWF